jgi:hypothetical protein
VWERRKLATNIVIMDHLAPRYNGPRHIVARSGYFALTMKPDSAAQRSGLQLAPIGTQYLVSIAVVLLVLLKLPSLYIYLIPKV